MLVIFLFELSSFFRTNNKYESHIKRCGKNDFCGAVMPSKDTKIIEFNQYLKFDKASSIIYADLESLIKRTDGCKNNFEKLSRKKVSEQLACGYSMSTTWTLLV